MNAFVPKNLLKYNEIERYLIANFAKGNKSFFDCLIEKGNKLI